MTPGEWKWVAVAADLLQAVSGTLVGCEARPYEGFTDPQGEVRQGGVTRTIFVSQAFHAGPIEVKVPPAHEGTFEKLRALGFGAEVEVICQVRANNNRVTLRLVSGEPASNGAKPANAPAK